MEALEALYDRHSQALLGYLFHIVRDTENARDLLHDTMVTIAKRASSYKHPRPFKPWIFTIARNLAFNFLKKARPKLISNGDNVDGEPLVMDHIASHGVSPEEAADTRQRVSDLMKVLDTLKSDEKEIVVLRIGQGLSYDEIAPIVGAKAEAVRQRVSRAVRKLKGELKPGK